MVEWATVSRRAPQINLEFNKGYAGVNTAQLVVLDRTSGFLADGLELTCLWVSILTPKSAGPSRNASHLSKGYFSHSAVCV